MTEIPIPATIVVAVSLLLVLLLIMAVVFVRLRLLNSGEDHMRNKGGRRGGVGWLLLPAVGLVVGGALMLAIDTALPGTAEIVIGAAIVVGVSLLLVLLLIMAAVFDRLGLSNPKEPLGLPQGSIRALIALELILIFILMGLFLYRSEAFGSSVHLTGLSSSQVAAIPTDKLDYLQPITTTIPTYGVTYSVTGTGITDTKTITLTGLTIDQVVNLPVGTKFLGLDGGTTNAYEAYIRTVPTESGADLAKQLLTTVGTLVVAVAGFYFGSQTVAAARGVAAPSLPVIRSIKPGEGKPGQEIKDIEILGKNFASPKAVKLVRGSDEMAFTDVVSNATRIQCKLAIPALQRIGKYELIVVNADGGEDRLSDAFEVKLEPPETPPSPVIQSIKPSEGGQTTSHAEDKSMPLSGETKSETLESKPVIEEAKSEAI